MDTRISAESRRRLQRRPPPAFFLRRFRLLAGRRKIGGMPHNPVRSKGTRRAKRRRIATTPHCFIPFDITREILLRLPARSLRRFRPVCKLWHSIIRDPHFIQSHLDRSRLPSIIFSAPRHYGGDSLYIVPLHGNKHLFSSVIQPYFSERFTVTGSCNGLVCIIKDSDATVNVLNPATGKYLTPPERTYGDPEMLSFGYHPVTKEYKLVHFFTKARLGIAPDLRLACEVYTLGSESWREIARFDHFSFKSNSAVSAKGFMYWLVCLISGIRLLHFDLRDESFTMISTLSLVQPYGGHYRIGHCLVDLHDSIYVSVFPFSMTDYVPHPQMDLWVLNGDEHSWTRKYSVPYSRGSLRDFLMPLLILKDKIMMHIVKIFEVQQNQEITCLLQYHLLRKYGEPQVKVRRRSSDKFEVVYDNNFIPHVHVESLVSLTMFQKQRAKTMATSSLVVPPTIQTYRWSESPP